MPIGILEKDKRRAFRLPSAGENVKCLLRLVVLHVVAGICRDFCLLPLNRIFPLASTRLQNMFTSREALA
jgi:hypothetical protein